MPANRTTPVRRRNGLLEACEPCRKRKLACDHTLPACLRCVRRKLASSCVYHGASVVRPVDAHREATEAASNPSGSPSSPTPAHSPGIRTTSSSPGTLIMAPLFEGSSGFLGQTSFSAVFLENRNRLEPPERSLAPASSCDKANAVDEDMVLLGASILAQLPDKETCTALFERYKRAKTAWWKLGPEQCMISMWTTFGQQLSPKNRRTTDLEDVSRLISRNSTVPLEAGEDFAGWLNAITANHLRWEVVGILFTSWAFGALSSLKEAEVFEKQKSRRKDRMQFVVEMNELAASCSRLCKRTVNPLGVLLSYNRCILETVIHGDSSLTAWTMHLDTIAATTFAGLHCDRGSSNNKVTFISQFRRRLFASVYEFDKQLATFTGRPPGLSWRYTSCPLPFDVSDETLIRGGRDLELAVEALDDQGWNINGQFYPATRLRAFCLLSQIRDEILEISLSPVTAETKPRINELKVRSHAMYARFPACAIYQHDEASIVVSSEGCSLQKMTLLRISLDHLQNHFLLERLALKCGQVDSQALVDISREILHLTSILWTQRDNFQARRYNLEWIAMFYAAPASGVLCVELLKHRHTTIPQRSKTIQNLTLFVAFLAWVQPSAPNADLCLAIKSIISRVLDQVLEGPAEAGDRDEAEALNSWNFDLPLPDDMNLLGAYNYSYAPWYAPEWELLQPEEHYGQG